MDCHACFPMSQEQHVLPCIAAASHVLTVEAHHHSPEIWQVAVQRAVKQWHWNPSVHCSHQAFKEPILRRLSLSSINQDSDFSCCSKKWMLWSPICRQFLKLRCKFEQVCLALVCHDHFTWCAWSCWKLMGPCVWDEEDWCKAVTACHKRLCHTENVQVILLLDLCLCLILCHLLHFLAAQIHPTFESERVRALGSLSGQKAIVGGTTIAGKPWFEVPAVGKQCGSYFVTLFCKKGFHGTDAVDQILWSFHLGFPQDLAQQDAEYKIHVLMGVPLPQKTQGSCVKGKTPNQHSHS